MRIPRAYFNGAVKVPSEVVLSGEEGRHLLKVLRRSPGDPVILVCDNGTFEGSLLEAREGASRSEAWVAVKCPAAVEHPPIVPWRVAVAVGKGESFESAVRMASELGIEGVVPMFTCRTAVRPPVGSSRTQRWQRLAVESAKQCGRSSPLRVEAPGTFPEVLGQWSRAAAGGPRGWLAVPSAPLRLSALLGSSGGPPGGPPGGAAPAPGWFFVGPEGGFSPEEAALGREAGLVPVGFPTPVLRVATAVAMIGALGVILESLEGSGFRVDGGETSG